MTSVSLNNVSKNYGSVNVLRNIMLEIEEGEFVALVGPSGCGKSTLLRMIAGLETISGGEVSIDGQVVNNTEARERDIAMVFQSYALYPHMTVAQNIGFPLRVRGEGRDEIRRSVADAADLTGLSELLDRKPKELSGGQRQRVAMGRAIVRKPKVFLFDEPLSNLDAKLRVQMRLQLREIHRKVSATSIYVTHDQVEAMTMADRVVLLNGGYIQQVGTPLELYERPANKFVGGFIGSPEMNFLEGRISTANGQLVFAGPEGIQIPIDEKDISALQAGKNVILGIRPQNLTISDHGIPVQFRDSEALGSETYVFAMCGATLLTSIIHGASKLQHNSQFFLRPEPDCLHFFDADGGHRLN